MKSAINNAEALFPNAARNHLTSPGIFNTASTISSSMRTGNGPSTETGNGKFRFKKRRERKAAIWQGGWFVFDELSNVCKCLCKGCKYTLKGRHNTTLENHLKVHHKEESRKFFQIKQVLAAEKAVLEQQNAINATSREDASSVQSSIADSADAVKDSEMLTQLSSSSPIIMQPPALLPSALSSFVFPSIAGDPQSIAAAFAPLLGQQNPAWPQVSLEKRWETKLAVMFAAERWPPSAVSSWAVRDFLAMSAPLGRSEMGDTQLGDLISAVHLNVTKNVETAIGMAECVHIGIHLMPLDFGNEALLSIVAIFYCMASQQLESALLSVARLPCSSPVQLAEDVRAIADATLQQWAIADRKQGQYVVYSSNRDDCEVVEVEKRPTHSLNGCISENEKRANASKTRRTERDATRDAKVISNIDCAVKQLIALESRYIYSYGAVLAELVDDAFENDATGRNLIEQTLELIESIENDEAAMKALGNSPRPLKPRITSSINASALHSIVERLLLIRPQIETVGAACLSQTKNDSFWSDLQSLIELLGPLKLHIAAFRDDESITIDKALPSLTQLIILLEKRCYGTLNSIADRLLETFRTTFDGILNSTDAQTNGFIFSLATSLNPALALALEPTIIARAQNELKERIRARASKDHAVDLSHQLYLQQATSAVDAFYDGLPLLAVDVNDDALDYWLSLQGNVGDAPALQNQLLFESVIGVLAVPASCALFRRLSIELSHVFAGTSQFTQSSNDIELERQALLRFNRKFIPDEV